MTNVDFDTFPVFTTEKLLLRSLQPTDVNEIFALRSNDEINKYINRQKATSIEDAAQFIQMILERVRNKETFIWAVQLKQENTLAGTVLLWNINKEKSETEIGYELLPQYHGKGIMQEAIKTILTFAFDELKFNSIIAVAHKYNLASLKVLQRNNFEFRKALENNMMEYELSSGNFSVTDKI
ncbi:GNAT family N-acetyltransferase [soil metagenome]